MTIPRCDVSFVPTTLRKLATWGSKKACQTLSSFFKGKLKVASAVLPPDAIVHLSSFIGDARADTDTDADIDKDIDTDTDTDTDTHTDTDTDTDTNIDRNRDRDRDTGTGADTRP